MRNIEKLHPIIEGEEIEEEVEPSYQALVEKDEKKILEQFSEAEQKEITTKQKILSSLAYFIGKDFEIPVELNEPGKGWYWNFRNNEIKIDPKDLLEKPMDYLRFVISHEGGHRRMSRVEFIPLEIWRQPGFSFMMNAIEDPRTNNFVAESYPKFKEQMKFAYDLDVKAKAIHLAKGKLGYQPRFMQAGFEYIKQWFREVKNESSKISEDLPEEVKEVVEKTLESARDSWWRYPDREEANESEDLIKKYAKVSYDINKDEIWPEFKKLVEKDLEDQKVQELLQDMQKDKGDSDELPQDLKDTLSPEQQKDLEEAIEKAIEETKKKQEEKSSEGEENGNGNIDSPIDLDSLSEELKQKIKDYLDSLPESQKKELAEKAQESLQEFEESVSAELEGGLSDNPEKKAEREKKEKLVSAKDKVDKKEKEKPAEKPKLLKQETEKIKKYRDFIEETLKKDANVYEEKRREILPLIDKLENDLRELFVARRTQKWRSGFKTGKRIDIKKRIQEKAKGITAVESKAWQRRDLPQEKDYAISLLIDLSGSMEGEKIEQIFNAVIVLTEVLNRLSIAVEILGFNDRIYEYQKYGQTISKEIRKDMGGMLQEVTDSSDTGKARWNDDGWALERASERLAKQKEKEKFLIVLSDGKPEESPMHPRSEYELHKMIEKVLKETDQKLIGLGIGAGTKHVEEYYPNSLADVGIEEMTEKLASLLRDVIVNYDKF